MSNPRIVDIPTLTQLLAEGATYTDAAKHFGVSRSSIYQAAYDFGLRSIGKPWAPPPPWTEEALCAQVDPEAFFPEKGESSRDAKELCASCEVREQCLDYALTNDERHGVWGGLTGSERRKLKKQRGAA